MMCYFIIAENNAKFGRPLGVMLSRTAYRRLAKEAVNTFFETTLQ